MAFCFGNTMARDFAKSFYKSKRWQTVRDYVLIRDQYKCRRCGQSGALEVHHIIHLTPENIYDGSISLNEKNLVTLCRNCHFKQHEEDKARGHLRSELTDCDDDMIFDENGYLVPKT